MFFSLLGCEKQQSSLYAPWAQVCNENRSTAITQKICAWAHTESPTCRFSAAFFGAFVFFFYFALCQMRPCYVCGAEGGVKGEWSGERQEDAGRNSVCPQRERRSEFQIHYKDKVAFVFVVVICHFPEATSYNQSQTHLTHPPPG